MRRIAVIGGGAAGAMAAGTAAGSGDAAVELFDAAVPLARILRTGGGRCNLTNAETDLRAFASCYPRGGRFLLSALARFSSTDAREWFTARGMPLVVEDAGRVFPRSGRAEDVRDVLAAEMKRCGVRTRARAAVRQVSREGEGGFRVAWGASGGVYDAVVIATGGDWQDGELSGYSMARSLGHSVTPLAPSLAALETAESWPSKLAGLTLPDAVLSAWDGKRRLAEERGSLLFTHDGVSGPVAFRISSRCAFVRFSAAAPLQVTAAIAPAEGGAGAAALLDEAAGSRPRQQLATVLRGLLPRSMADLLPSLAGMDPSLPAGQVSRRARAALADLFDKLPLSIVGTRRGAEMVTAGGVDLDEVDPRTMESRLVPGLFYAGEVLDVDGFTGGYNLQAAWATGHCAGLAAAGRTL